jgi:hypothetical protein
MKGKYLTPEQRAKIVALIQNPAFYLHEKNKLLLNLNKLNKERGDVIISKLEYLISKRGA